MEDVVGGVAMDVEAREKGNQEELIDDDDDSQCFFFSYFFNYFIHFSLIIISKISKLKARLKLDLIFNNFKIRNKKSLQQDL